MERRRSDAITPTPAMYRIFQPHGGARREHVAFTAARFGGALRRNYIVVMVLMNTLRFEWDEAKAESHARKHGVTFEEARSVFFDENARLIDDPDHSEEEDRFILLGLSNSLDLLVVSHCYRSEGNCIRIISARKATARESRAYTW